MQKLKFCPSCGIENLNWDFDKKWTCTCGFTLYHNVASAVAVIIKHKDEIMFTKRNQDPQKGKLDLAGGFVDPKESAENACKRELYEELKINIDNHKLKYLGSLPNTYHYKGIDYSTLDMFFEYEILQKEEMELDFSEISETVWVRYKDIDYQEIAFDSQKIFLQKLQ